MIYYQSIISVIAGVVITLPRPEDPSYTTYQAWRSNEHNLYWREERSSNPHGQSEMLLSEWDKAGFFTFEQKTQAVAVRLHIYFQSCYHYSSAVYSYVVYTVVLQSLQFAPTDVHKVCWNIQQFSFQRAIANLSFYSYVVYSIVMLSTLFSCNLCKLHLLMFTKCAEIYSSFHFKGRLLT
jgi:hypothetical protein